MLRPIFHRLAAPALFGVALSLSSASVWATNETQFLPFSQDWSNASLIIAQDNWNGVPGITGYTGENLNGSDPQSLLDGELLPAQVQVTPNNPDYTSDAIAGIAEFPGVVALRPNSTYNAPFLLLSFSTIDSTQIRIRYTLRDLDDTPDRDAQSQVALQYRIGESGDFINIPAAYVTDATNAGTAIKTTDVSVLLPADAEDRSLVQLRIITANNVVGGVYTPDEWIGVDDIEIYETTPVLVIENATVFEGTPSGFGSCVTTPMDFTVYLLQPALKDITFTYNTIAGSATSNDDFTHVASQQGTIFAGDTSTTITINAICDSLAEPTETFTVNLVDLIEYDVFGGVGVGTIKDDDYILSIADSSVTEGTPGSHGPGDHGCTTTPMEFTVTSNRPAPPGGIVFSYSTGDPGDTAIPSSDPFALETSIDYNSNLTGNGTILGGSDYTTITVPVRCDSNSENDETFTVTLGDLPGYSLAPNLGYIATGTILDDDRPRLSIADTQVIEGNSGADGCIKTPMRFTVTSDKPAPAGGIEFSYATWTGGTATADIDYTPVLDSFISTNRATGTIDPGDYSTSISVQVTCDTEIEANETVRVLLTHPNSSYNLEDNEGFGTIFNDDGPTLSIEDVSVVEGDEGSVNAVFEIRLSEAALADIELSIGTEDNSATGAFAEEFVPNQSDYEILGAGATIQAGDTSLFVVVPVYGDTLREPNETFQLNVISAIGPPLSATATILNDDGPTLSIADASIVEGNAGTSTLAFQVTLSEALPVFALDGSNIVSFSIATLPPLSGPGYATAGAGNDFMAKSTANFTIPGGQTSAEFHVTVNGDTALELDETFQVGISNVVNANPFGSSRLTATGTIENDDLPLVPTFAVYNTDNGNTVWEGNGNPAQACFQVHLFLPGNPTAGAAHGVNVGTVAGTAAANSDFIPITSQNVVLSADDDDSGPICVDIVNDNSPEPAPETFSLNLSAAGNANGAVIGTASAPVTVLDDDSVSQPTISISANSSVVPESNGQAGFTVRLFMPQSGFIIIPPGTRYTVDVAAALGSSATEGEDFSFNPAVVELSPEDPEETVYVDIIPDDEPEDTETLVLQLMNPDGAVIGDAMASTDIVDSLSVTSPTFFISDAEPVWEGNGNPLDQAQFDVSLVLPDGSSPGTLYTVTVNSMPGSASSPRDFLPIINQTVVLSGNNDRQTVSVTIVDDLVQEGAPENFTLVLSGATGGAVIGDDTGLGTIEDNDLVDTPTFLISSPGALEEDVGRAEATVSLLLPPGVTGRFEVLVSAETGSGPYAAQEGNGADGDFTFPPQYVELSHVNDSDPVTINIHDDTLGENTENFSLRLSDPVNVSNPTNTVIIGDGIGAAAIIDNDGGPTVTDPTDPDDTFANGFSDGFE